MNMKKIFFLALFIASVSFHAFSQKAFSKEEQDVIDDIWNLRMQLTVLENDADAANEIDSYRVRNAERFASVGEEASILIDSLLTMEKYNYLYTFPGENKETKKSFAELRKKIRDFNEGKKDSEITPYMHLCYADITAYYMAYSIKDIIFNGMTVKRQQEKALAQDPTFSPAMVNLAQWYYYSPSIFGGSKEQTRYWQLKSIECARNDAEKFYAKTAYSQFLFEMGELEESKRELEDCALLCPGSRFVKLLQEQNSLGLSLNDYNKNRSKLLKSADDYKKKNNMSE